MIITIMKRQRESSDIDCEIIEVSEKKIKISAVIDLTSDDSNESQNFIKSTTMANIEDNKNLNSINKSMKLENNSDSTENYSYEKQKLLKLSPGQNASSTKEIISQDSTVLTATSVTNSCETHFSEGIDELFDDDWDDIENNQSDSSNNDLNTLINQQNVETSTTSLPVQKLQDKPGISGDSAIFTANSELNSVDTHFCDGIDDLLNDDWDYEEENNSDPLRNDSNTSSSDVNTEVSTNLLPTENQSSKKHSISEDSAVITANSCETHFSEGIDDLFLDGWDDDDDADDTAENSLDLSDYKRCKIIAVNRKLRCMELTLKDLELPKRAVVLCTENWRDMSLELGESIIIKAKYSDLEKKWVINNEYGMCVTQPDTLVSGTAVIQGLFCNRKGVLQYKFPGIDCLPNIEANDAALTCGSITHQLLQTALEEKIYKLDEVWKLLDRILKLPSTITLLYISDLTVKQFKEMISEYIPQVYEFISRYIKGNQPQQYDDNFAGKIEDIRDIEENVWLPTLGLKGKIDVTAEVSIHERRKIMPIEIKTGRSLFSPEHKGQVYLYVMMMQMLGYDLSSGLLLYIKENKMHEITSTRNEQRDLLLLRNMMAYYLSRTAKIVDTPENSETTKRTKWKLPQLPEPIYHNTACKRCSFNTICSVYAKHDEDLILPHSHPHSKIQEKVLNNLTVDHIDYVVHWISLIEMESSYEKAAEKNQAIYSREPIQRENQRTCLSYMTFVSPVIKKNDMFVHKFMRDPKERIKHLFPFDDFRQIFDVSDYVMISTDIRMNIISGGVVKVTRDSISLSFEKDISKMCSMKTYHIDEFPSTTLPYRALGTVAAMLSDNDITRRLRRIIIDKEPATFTNELPNNVMIGTGEKIMNQLNSYQQEALKAVITAKDFVLIKGMPGTGKTQTLVALIEMLSYLGRSVLITAHTHMAIDNILLKLNEKNIDFLRLGKKARVHPSLRNKSEDYLMSQCETPEQLDAKYNKKNIVAVTCLGSHNALLSKRIFDYCIVDECTQVLQPFLLRPLYNAIKFVLVGDPEQLPAVVRCNESRKLGMDEDLFTRLDSKINTRILKQQYRMNKPIMDLANRLTYKSKLLAGNEQIANATLKWENPMVIESCEKWIKKTLSCNLEDSVVMLNTKTTYNMHLTLKTQNNALDKNDETSHCSNYIEAAIIVKLLSVLFEAGINTEDIGVIAPYQAQLKLLKRVIKFDVEINTVDQFQGRDKSVILYSCTRTGESERKRNDEYEVLNDHKRLNVALTRAKHKLIIIGDKASLMRLAPFKKLFGILSNEIIDLCEDSYDFSWNKLIKLVQKNEETL